ncbi:hypothetical protein LWE61_14890 [Sphingobium sufflavum]|uniref:hypothetical protein n=1 Tax=Sphingobium sufflavum TaxID=1129547 RepID=UPI001F458D00|nr:hypothetical protein [Sphingobium sufflavum]MCE7797836.1 hypothetical protein [Sphingobium sufflavum]
MSLDLSSEFENIVTAQVTRFTAWASKNWQLDSKDELEMRRQGHSADYLAGYNAALDGLQMAIEVWIDEGGPSS